MSVDVARGSCLCGAVRYEARNPRTGVTACHCSQCRKQSGHFWASSTCALDDFTPINEEGLKWYRASDFASRGFCERCGSAVLWKHDDEDRMSFSAGSLDDSSRFRLTKHIFTDDKGSYYEID
ncbi:MAG: GFA family protein [Pseudomonadota bacterium]